MKDFMLIFKGTNYNDMGLSPKELQQKLGKWKDWTIQLNEKGIYKGGEALKSEVRRMAGSEQVITDRTSAELKEVVGGYFIITVKDLEEATEIARSYPDFDTPGGAVEIREVARYNG